MQVQQSLFKVHNNGMFQTVVENHLGFTHTLDSGTILGTAVEFKEVVSTEVQQTSLPLPLTACEAMVRKVEMSPSKVE